MRVNTQQQFIDNANRVHNGRYDYSLVMYTHNKTPVTIICPHHGAFEQKPVTHTRGHGCPICGREKTTATATKTANQLRMTTEQFVTRAAATHGAKYDYSITKYVNWKTKVDITCRTHGIFKQSPGKHIDSKHPTGCPKCANKQQTTEDFIKKSCATHGDLYDYSKSIYTNDTTKITITCREHGDFNMLPSNHHSLGQGCNRCALIKAQENIGYYAEHLFTTHPARKQEPATLYYVRMHSDTETFFKVGITTRKHPHKRFYGMPYTVDIIKIVPGTLYELWLKEQSILQTVTPYKPHTKFNGWTECFTDDVLPML